MTVDTRSPPPLRILDAGHTAAALPFPELIAALRLRFQAGCAVPPRQVHTLHDGAGGGSGLTSLVMAAWVPGLCYGVKVVNVAPGNAARGLPGLHASYLLYDASTGVPLALLDGDVITARRTAAASALAASWLSREDASHLLVLGAGRVAALLPAAHGCVRPLRQVSVWARRADQAQALAQQLCSEGHAATAVTDLAAAAASADIVSCATLASAPIVQGRWLQPGSHLDLIGGFTPAMREADDACLSGAAVYIDTEEALAKSGDLLGPIESGVLRRGDVRGTLAQLARGDCEARGSATQRTVFKSVGTALEDLAAAMLALGIRHEAAAMRPQP